MTCTCGNILTSYRTVGIFDNATNNKHTPDHNHNVFLHWGGSFMPIAMVTCDKCGKIEFYSADAEILQNLTNDSSPRPIYTPKH